MMPNRMPIRRVAESAASTRVVPRSPRINLLLTLMAALSISPYPLNRLSMKGVGFRVRIPGKQGRHCDLGIDLHVHNCGGGAGVASGGRGRIAVSRRAKVLRGYAHVGQVIPIIGCSCRNEGIVG